MALNIRKKAQDVWKAILEANTYISAGSIPVVEFWDNTQSRAKQQVLIHADQEQNLNLAALSRGPLWQLDINMSAITYISEDKDRALLNALYQEILEEARDTTIAELNTGAAGAITFVGVTMVGLGEQEVEVGGSWQRLTVIVECHIQK